MREYPSTEVKQRWGTIADAALQEPVRITKYGRGSHIVMSSADYDDLLRKAYMADVKAKLQEGIRAADNGEFTTMSVSEIRKEAERLFDSERD